MHSRDSRSPDDVSGRVQAVRLINLDDQRLDRLMERLRGNEAAEGSREVEVAGVLRIETLVERARTSGGAAPQAVEEGVPPLPRCACQV